eukprot:7385439-Prymnesium_polylepis.2
MRVRGAIWDARSCGMCLRRVCVSVCVLCAVYATHPNGRCCGRARVGLYAAASALGCTCTLQRPVVHTVRLYKYNPWPMAYDAPGGGLSGATTRALRCRVWHE